MEMQARTIVRRYPTTRIASLRLSWSIPSRQHALEADSSKRKNDLWAYVQEDSGAEAFLLALTEGGWTGHEAFFVCAPETAHEEESGVLKEMWWGGVRIKEGASLEGHRSFFDCSKAERLLGWRHREPE